MSAYLSRFNDVVHGKLKINDIRIEPFLDPYLESLLSMQCRPMLRTTAQQDPSLESL